MKLGMRMAGYATRAVPRSVKLRVRQSPKLNRLVWSAMNAVVPSELQVVEITGGPLAGARMSLDLKREKGFWAGTFEPWVQDTFVEHFRTGGCGWDVGAYVGYHTLLLHRLAGAGNVVAVEPDPDLRGRLLGNLELNSATGVDIVAAAAAEAPGTLTLMRHADPIQNSVERSGGGETVDVAAITLDSLLDDHRPPTIVKMDIEGGEVSALRGAKSLLFDVRPLWLMELHWELGAEALRALEDAGYDWAPLDHPGDVFAELEAGGTRHVLARPRPA